MKVLVLGADGFIGRHVIFHLRQAGHEVLAQARKTSRLENMGFATLRAELTDPICHDPAFWRPHLQGRHLVNCAGLLNGSEADFDAVHVRAPRAVLEAMGRGSRAVLISAVGLGADTRFARFRKRAEVVFAGQTILRAGLVLGDTSYGGSSLLRAFCALPCVLPVVGDGTQPFNPVHATDLARVVEERLTAEPGLWEIGGPETIRLDALSQAIRGWLGLKPARLLRLPLPLARALGHLGGLLRLGPISATSVRQLEQGVLAEPAPDLPGSRGVSEFLAARPAGTQDLWQARLYLIKPLIRLTLAVLWLWSAALGLSAGPEEFAEVEAPLWLARAGGLADLVLGACLLANVIPRAVAITQLAIVFGYTVGLSLMAPFLWLDPFGGLLKNLPILALILVHLILTEER